ncbi:alpha/beta hydrolase family protein [Fibrella arboris]|uniref:alpha/beta hydrolase family protein n=1 Tax=Fibrella arboris TaxID=3242486 RepID=UPI0035211BF2
MPILLAKGRCLALVVLLMVLENNSVAQEMATTVATRKAFLQLIDHPRVPLAPIVRVMPNTDGLRQEHFTYAAEKTQRVPGILLKPDDQRRRPVVVVLHGTGGTKEGQWSVLKTLTNQGFIAIAIDGRYHGERQTGTGSAQYVAAMLQTYRTGQEHPFLYDTVWDVLRLIDYLETRPDVDASRIGVIGFSKGGMETYLAAAVDPRIAVAVPMIGVQSFRWALDNNRWMSRVGTFQLAVDEAAKETGTSKIDAAFIRTFYDRVAPGIYTRFDGPAMVPLIVPRPLLVINGDSDDRTPLPGLDECMAPTKQAYHRAGADDKVKLYIQKDTGHAVTPAALQAAVDWLVTWLKP